MTLFFWIVSLCAVVAWLFCQLTRRFSDGPIGPIPGGKLRSGVLVNDAEIDWSFASEVQLAQLELKAPLASRTTGILVHEGQLYIPCDLGFIWRRVAPPAKWLMAIVWWVKRWHEQALADGRAAIRIRGKRYERRAVRVEDPALLAALRVALQQRAEGFLSSPLSTDPPDPDAIWFFRLDPRQPKHESRQTRSG